MRVETEAFLRLRPKGCTDAGENTPIAAYRTINYYASACWSG
jgi:hypothetical protein